MQILAHPLLLLVIGAVLTGFLIPWTTRHRQHYQKELELKTELVAEISEAVMTAVIIAEVAHGIHNVESSYKDESDTPVQINLDFAYQEWMIRSCIIGSKIHAYYPDFTQGDIPTHIKWIHFSGKLTSYFKRLRNPASTATAVQAVERDSLLECKAKLIQELLETRMTGWKIKLVG